MRPTDILKEEHRNIERMLAALENAVAEMETNGSVPLELLQSAVRFIRLYADACHHGKEEQVLFPKMIQRGFPEKEGPIAVMLDEHEKGRAYVRELASAVERFAAGEEEARKPVVDGARSFIEHLRHHIFKEDNMLFVMADGHLSAGDQEEMLKRFEELHSDGTPCAEREELIGLLRSLE